MSIVKATQAGFTHIIRRGNSVRNFSKKKPVLSERLQKRVKERPPPLNVTKSAAERIKELLSDQDSEITKGIRLSLRTRGCNGMSYTINYATNETIQESDVITFQENVNIYIDNTSMFYLLGTQIDYIENHIRSEFTFSNPNAQGTCGCGESFNV